MELMYPSIITFSIIISFVMLLFWRVKNNFKKGIIVANTKYVKNTGYYKKLLVKYRIYNILIKIACICLIITCAILTARIYRKDKFEEEYNNRDIMLCMDVSGSVISLNHQTVESLKKTVSALKDERFGISVFNTSSISIMPLTTDYNYSVDVLDQIDQAISVYTRYVNNGYREDFFNYISNDDKFVFDFLFEGAEIDVNRGSSLIGEGLAYCASQFNKKDNRSKVIIFTTDNKLEANSRPLVSLKQAADYCKANNIKVYSIGTSDITSQNRQGLVSASNTTGGGYYDLNSFSTNDIVDKINELGKSAIVRNVYVRKKDLPERIFPYVLVSMFGLLILDWRVRI